MANIKKGRRLFSRKNSQKNKRERTQKNTVKMEQEEGMMEELCIIYILAA